MADMKVSELIRDIHRNAVDHGWWDDERGKPEIIALIHSEWSEALEEARAGRPLRWYGDGGKPEGAAVELIDGVIRIFDYIGRITAEADVSVYLDGDVVSLYAALPDGAGGGDIATWIAWLHWHTSYALCYQPDEQIVKTLLDTAGLALKWVQEHDIDPIDVLMEKHEYNKSRPYRHGKLF